MRSNPIKSTLMSAAILTTLALPSIASAAYYEGNNFVYSATGPGQGHGALNLGTRAYFVGGENFVAVPTVDIQYVYGLSHALDWETRLSTIGAVSLLDTGLRWRILGDSELSLAVRADASALIAFAGTSEGSRAGGLFGATPGVVLSGGTRRVQFSVGLDVPMLLGSGEVGSIGGVETMKGESNFGYAFRPWLGVEIPVSRSVNINAQAQAYLDRLSDDANVLPAVSIGASW